MARHSQSPTAARSPTTPARRPPAAQEAPPRVRRDGTRCARDRLMVLRGDDVGRPGPPRAREPPAVQERAELGRRRSKRGAARHADEQRSPHPRPVRGHLADRQAGGRRNRGPAVLRASQGRLPGDRARRRPGRPAAEHRPGRVDDHAAVREERPPHPGQPNGVPEAARVGARLPPRAPLVEGQDPHRVPELDLLWRGRIRDRGGGADVLPMEPPGMRREGNRCASSSCPRRRRCWRG